MDDARLGAPRGVDALWNNRSSRPHAEWISPEPAPPSCWRRTRIHGRCRAQTSTAEWERAAERDVPLVAVEMTPGANMRTPRCAASATLSRSESPVHRYWRHGALQIFSVINVRYRTRRRPLPLSCANSNIPTGKLSALYVTA
jgi:hypothetical protein